MTIDLSQGGASWAGWTFGRWGKARDWRLVAPDDSNYTAAEVWELRALLVDLDFYRVRVRELELLTQKTACYFSDEDAAVVRAAVRILGAILPNRNHPRPGSAPRNTSNPAASIPACGKPLIQTAAADNQRFPVAVAPGFHR